MAYSLPISVRSLLSSDLFSPYLYVIPLFLGLPPSASRGVISKVIYHNGEPLILESDAQVHSGASGGMLIHASTGAFLGLITSNTQSRDGVTYPTLNNSIPALYLHDALSRFVKGHKGTSP